MVRRMTVEERFREYYTILSEICNMNLSGFPVFFTLIHVTNGQRNVILTQNEAKKMA